jgi:hypothetical protein
MFIAFCCAVANGYDGELRDTSLQDDDARR